MSEEYKWLEPPEGCEAQLIIVYNLMEGSGFDELNCKMESRTRFEENVTPEAKQVVNTAARILCDKENVSLIYTSVLSNMLHVPAELRKKPN